MLRMLTCRLTTLAAPEIEPIPGPYFFQLTNDVNGVGGVSIPVNGAFYRFSAEVSIVGQIRGSARHPTE